jgi:ABC-type transport system substrate-binding protein
MGLKNFSGEEAATLAEQWKEGTVAVPAITTVTASPQFVNPTPPILADVRFRRALVHALNREELAALPGGLGMVPHSILDPLVPEYEPSQPAVVKYDYDLRRTAQLLEELGYSKDAEGFYRDAAGNKPVVEARTNTTAANQRAALFASDQWNRAGIASELLVFSTAQSTNLEFRRTFPAFEILGLTGGRKIDRYLSCGAGLPSNNYAGTCGGNNRSNYMNPRLDDLINRFSSTIPWGPRMEAFNEAMHLVTDQVVVVGMAYTSDGNMVSNRLENVTQTVWNAEQWGLK